MNATFLFGYLAITCFSGTGRASGGGIQSQSQPCGDLAIYRPNLSGMSRRPHHPRDGTEHPKMNTPQDHPKIKQNPNFCAGLYILGREIPEADNILEPYWDGHRVMVSELQDYANYFATKVEEKIQNEKERKRQV